MSDVRERLPRMKRQKGRFGITGALLMMLAAYIVVLMISQQVQIAALDHQHEGIQERVLRLQAELDAVYEQRQLLLSDSYVEMLARKHLGMVKPGEIPYTVAEQK